VSAAPLRLPNPDPGNESHWVNEHLAELYSGPARDANASHPELAGTQSAANEALARLNLRGYASLRNQVMPVSDRGATRLSAWIRYGLLSLPSVAEAAEHAPGSATDRSKFIDELWWQEYARHLYARLGPKMAFPLRFTPPEQAVAERMPDPDQIWDREMLCVGLAREELETEGYLVNQTRMWLASQWTVRHGAPWRVGEDLFFRHLLDGSRAANRLGWQWTIGAGTGKVYGFSRWQVNKRCPGLCDRCALQARCPIEDWPEETQLPSVQPEPRLRRDETAALTAGPVSVHTSGEPKAVWITAESLGDNDPALLAHDKLPVVFIWDEKLLRRLQLSGHRLVYLTQRLAELGRNRDLQIWRGSPSEVLSTLSVATTFTPVPGFRRIADGIHIAELHPWPWLARPSHQTATSYTAWRKALSGRSQPSNP
jgi:deoxyribodipyrimidine photo-lyase